MYKIKELPIEKIVQFWEKLSESFRPRYEMEDLNDFLEFVSQEINKSKAKYYGIFDTNDNFIGGFRLAKTISYFFIDEPFDDKYQVVKKIIDMIEVSKKFVFTKER